ncbi:glycosyltransferase family 4 protein [Geothermobacter hydrogeniphilus]|uniref:Uncharacterized protein n=1 Tax=Geothermobacter hydrogeniphilus TaxID=1969733 RepID=A0A1X0XSK3_9BACT|nr:glycosyltransferase family 4 protein [Geothermobacter hydrogeniphilus]ORJ55881.1 hypothetical protein B5V00_14895 [Geothermobacter hydrogeniphilus]
MKILFLCYSLEIGGLETYMLRFSRWLVNKHTEHQLHVACKSGQFGSYESEFRKLGVVIHSMPMGYLNPIPYFRFHRFLMSEQYDTICDFTGDFGALPILVSYLSNIRNRLVFYRSACDSYKPTRSKLLYQRLLNHIVRSLCTHVLSNSQAAFDNYFKDYHVVDDCRFQLIRNGIPRRTALSSYKKEMVRSSLGILPGQKVVLHVGSGRWEKNHACMLKIAKIAQDKDDNVCFCFAGRGVEEKHGLLASQLGLGNVRFLGERSDVDNLLQIADFFLFPSLSEGQPNALLEAMSCGVPFIASNIAPILESLPSGWDDCWLIPPDAPEQGYSLLKEHMNNNYREEPNFKSLVEWCNDVYCEDRCFGFFLETLTT